jgi:hypothetical protein
MHGQQNVKLNKKNGYETNVDSMAGVVIAFIGFRSWR